MPEFAAGVQPWTTEELETVERSHASGLTVQEIVQLYSAKRLKLTEATFRKYVQLGLLPRSVRVARKGRERGSQGVYPATVVRQIEQIRQLMAKGYTIEEIQREFLFVRGDVEALARQFERIGEAVERVNAHRNDELATKKLGEARFHFAALLEALEAIEARMSMRARMARAAV